MRDKYHLSNAKDKTRKGRFVNKNGLLSHLFHQRRKDNIPFQGEKPIIVSKTKPSRENPPAFAKSNYESIRIFEKKIYRRLLYIYAVAIIFALAGMGYVTAFVIGISWYVLLITYRHRLLYLEKLLEGKAKK